MIKNVRISLVLLLICGLIYPLSMTGLAQAIMPKQAEGSLITDANGTVIGSELIGQTFSSPRYFHGRISSVENNAAGSGSNNYAPSNPALKERVEKDITAFLQANPGVKREQIPADLLTNSASGLDPHISPQAALVQVPRIAKERGISAERIEKLIGEQTDGPSLRLFGESRVNVLKLNLALDQLH